MWFVLLLARLPLRFLYGCSYVVAAVLGGVVGYRRGVVDENLAHAFGEMDERALGRLRRAFYRHLADVMVEILRGFQLSARGLCRRMEYIYPEKLQKRWEAGHSVVFFASHQGNWEWALAGGALQVSLPLVFVPRPIRSPLFARLMHYFRHTRFGVEVVSGRAYLSRVRKREPCIYLVVADQCPQEKDAKQWAMFFGRETAFFRDLERIPALLDAPVYFLEVQRKRRGYYTVTTHELNHSEPLLPQYARALEAAIRADPARWLWSHRRWKYMPSDTTPQKSSHATKSPLA